MTRRPLSFRTTPSPTRGATVTVTASLVVDVAGVACQAAV